MMPEFTEVPIKFGLLGMEQFQGYLIYYTSFLRILEDRRVRSLCQEKRFTKWKYILKMMMMMMMTTERNLGHTRTIFILLWIVNTSFVQTPLVKHLNFFKNS